MRLQYKIFLFLAIVILKVTLFWGYMLREDRKETPADRVTAKLHDAKDVAYLYTYREGEILRKIADDAKPFRITKGAELMHGPRQLKGQGAAIIGHRPGHYIFVPKDGLVQSNQVQSSQKMANLQIDAATPDWLQGYYYDIFPQILAQSDKFEMPKHWQENWPDDAKKGATPSVMVVYKKGASGLKIRAFAVHHYILIEISGQDILDEAPKIRIRTKAQIAQNLAHEMVHIWQSSIYDPKDAFHEGAAEAISMMWLRNIQHTDEYSVFMSQQKQRKIASCAKAMEQGALMDILDAQLNYQSELSKAAAYDCGQLFFEKLQRKIEKGDIQQLYFDYAHFENSQNKMTQFLQANLKPEEAEKFEAFLENDYRSHDRRKVIQRFLTH